MNNRHYYIEDIGVDPQKKETGKSYRSIQFDELENTIYINIDEPNGKKLVRASVQIPKSELHEVCKWFNLI